MWENLEERIRNLQTTNTQLKIEIEQLKRDCSAAEKALSGFEARYNRIVKPIAEQVEAVRKAIENLKQRQIESMIDWSTDAQDTKDWYAQHREKLRDLPSLDEKDEIFESANRPKENRFSRLKRIYRSLARRFHPDLGQDEEDRQRRNKIMKQINKAYQDGDVEMLESLDDATPEEKQFVVDEFVPMAVTHLRRLQKEYDGLEETRLKWKTQLHQLKYGHIMELKLQEALIGRDHRNTFLQSVADELTLEYQRYARELDELKRGLR